MPVRLSISLNRRLDRRLGRYSTRMLDGARRPPRPDYLAIACRHIARYLRISKKWARQYPLIYGPKADAYFLETVQLAKYRAECLEALRKVYGPDTGVTPSATRPGVWAERYAGAFPPWPPG